MDKLILRKLSYGVYIIAAKDEDTLYGCVANSVMQINQNTIALSLNKLNHTTKAILKTKKLSINILGINTNIELINTFGFKKSEEVNKYEQVNYELKENVPILNDSLGYIIGDVISTTDTETHTIILMNIIDMNVLNDEEVLTYSYYQNYLKGKTNKAAPTYQEEKVTEPTKKHVFRCKICGYQFESDLEELPDDFKCPLCGAGKEYFEKIK